MNPTEKLLAELIGDEAADIMSQFDIERIDGGDWLVASLTNFADDCLSARNDTCALRTELERLRELVGETDVESIDRVLEAEGKKTK